MVLRAFISLDFEGLPYIVSKSQLGSGRSLWDEGRKIATRVVCRVVESLLERGFKEIVVADSHGEMVNVHPDSLPEGVLLVRGFPRPTSMVAGAEDCSAAFLLGYHAAHGTKDATLDHTYSSSVIEAIEVNGVRTSEYLLSALVLGEMGVPVVLVAGDEALRSEVERHTPWSVFVPLKRSLGRYSAVSPSLNTINRELDRGVEEALRRLKSGEARPLPVKRPVRVRMVFQSSGYAEVADYLPLARRVSGLAVEFEASTMREAYSTIELLVLAAYGLKSLVER